MSGDAYKDCPICEGEHTDLMDQERGELDALYGTITRAEYDMRIAILDDKTRNVPGRGCVRVDIEISLPYNILIIQASARCEECKTMWDLEGTANPSVRGDDDG